MHKRTLYISLGVLTAALMIAPASSARARQIVFSIVELQSQTPGTAQTGHINVSGTIRAGGAGSANGYGVYGVQSATGNYGILGAAREGVFAHGANVDGLFAETASSGGSGVSGTNLATNSFGYLGTGNNGVVGISVGAYGVYAQTGSGYASYGIQTGTGNYGILGATREGVFAHGANVDGVFAETSAPTGTGVVGSNLSSGGAGYIGSGPEGVVGSGASYPHGSVIGLSIGSGIYKTFLTSSASDGGVGMVLTNNGSGQRLTGMSYIAGSPSSGAIAVGDGTTAYAAMYRDPMNGNRGTLYADMKDFRIPNPQDERTEIVYACIEGPEAAAYCRGTGTLVNGKASIALPDHFQTVAAARSMTVQLTPSSPSSKGLCCTSKSPQAIEVCELAGGTGSYDFDYVAMAVRKGHESFQPIQPKLRIAAIADEKVQATQPPQSSQLQARAFVRRHSR